MGSTGSSSRTGVGERSTMLCTAALASSAGQEQSIQSRRVRMKNIRSGGREGVTHSRLLRR
jgi:hypothetical protein